MDGFQFIFCCVTVKAIYMATVLVKKSIGLAWLSCNHKIDFSLHLINIPRASLANKGQPEPVTYGYILLTFMKKH